MDEPSSLQNVSCNSKQSVEPQTLTYELAISFAPIPQAV